MATKVRFEANQIAAMAEYIVTLTKMGAAYKVENYIDGWTVEVTGF